METAKSNKTFCFGDGVEVKADKAAKFPVIFVGVKGISAYTETDVIKNDLPPSYEAINKWKLMECFWILKMRAVGF